MTVIAGRRLREAAWTDIPALAALDAALFGADAWSESTWWAEFAGRPRRWYVVIEADPQEAPGPEDGPVHGVVGYAGVDLGDDVADVMTIAVVPAARGAGYGRMLLAALVESARAAGAAHLMLEVRADNGGAINLYAAAGFATVKVRRRYYQPDDVDALIMRKDLQP